MAAPKGNKNSLGNSGGKTKNDRELAARVRTLTLEKIEHVLNNEAQDKVLFNAVLIKLAGSVLPRLNEHAGEGGGPIEQRVIYLPQRDVRVDTTSRQAD